MLITLTERDFKRLSAACQQELLALLTLNDAESQAGEDHAPLAEEDWERHLGDAAGQVRPVAGRGLKSRKPVPPVGDPIRKKEILEISVEQARQLVVNVNARNKATLNMLAATRRVQLNTLVGPGAAYSGNAQFNRSLIGAVNRKLRAVTGNRDAALFACDAAKSRITVSAVSAAALREALDVAEPLPYFEFYDQNGSQIDHLSTNASAFTKLVEAAWSDIKVRPEVGYAGLSVPQIIEHLMKHGFKLVGGKVAAESEGETGRFEYQSEFEDVTAVISRVDRDGTVCLGELAGVISERIFLIHESVPSVFGEVRVNAHNLSSLRVPQDDRGTVQSDIPDVDGTSNG
jgi:hypothetical protein